MNEKKVNFLWGMVILFLKGVLKNICNNVSFYS